MSAPGQCSKADESCRNGERLRRGMCWKHYAEFLESRPNPPKKAPCAIECCATPSAGRGLCSKHLWRARQDGTVAQYPKVWSWQTKFWEKVEKTSTCWLWLGAKNPGGYGSAWDGTKTVRAHRLAYELIRGPIPDDLVVDHLCRIRHCVNPDHLEPVTGLENMRRGISFAAINRRKTHCKHGHELTPENTYASSPYRVCVTCARDRASEGKRRRRALKRANEIVRES